MLLFCEQRHEERGTGIYALSEVRTAFGCGG